MGFSSTNALADKIRSTQRKWKVLESEDEDENGDIRIVDDFD